MMKTVKCSFETLKKFIAPAKEETSKITTNGIVMIPFKGEEKEFVVLGIGMLPDGTKYMDIMSKELLLIDTKWKEELKDQYYSRAESQPLNYTRSDIITVLNDQLKHFPKVVQEATLDREASYLDTISSITGEKTYKSVNIGKVWIPSLYEVFGLIDCYSDDDPNNQQYEYFKNEDNRKMDRYWWLRSACAFINRSAYFVYGDGDWYCGCADYEFASVLCLRVKLVEN